MSELQLANLEIFSEFLSKYFNVHEYGINKKEKWAFVIEHPQLKHPLYVEIDPFNTKDLRATEEVLTQISSSFTSYARTVRNS